jgi:tyrosyl-tRNA synthetase
MAPSDARERFALITENLAEILNPELIENILAEGRNPRIYWGTSLLSSLLQAWHNANSGPLALQVRLQQVALTADTLSRP